jgi:L-ascorbate metabolism protein UlaG (beta-lactamase superfamily)
MAKLRRLAALSLVAAVWPLSAFATCYPVAQSTPRFIPARFDLASVKAHHVRIDYVGHSSFEIESPEGIRVVTDYNGYIRPRRVPHIVTMNRAHDTHFTDFVEKEIQFALRGWDPEGGIARHNMPLKDVRVRNIPTNIQDWGGKLVNNNSMFVIETVGLCIVHISHLHHVLSKEQLRDLGRIDIAFAPIDGMWTMSHQELFEVLDAIKPMLIIPMHYGSMGGVEAFVARAQSMWSVRRHESSTIELSFRDLPRKTEVLFLEGY